VKQADGPRSDTAVAFRGVSKRYGGVTAVDDVSFSIEPGTLVTLLGPSGCGKTTTLRLIAGLEMCSSGSIEIGGRDVTRLSAADRDVCMVFQSYALFPHMSVLDNAAYGPVVSGIAKPRAHEMAREKLALVGLNGFDDRLPSELSGGQQQRVAVARALVLEPEVLLFDEPLSNLDAKLRRRVRDEIRELQQRLRLTVAYVTHDQQEALAVSDQIIVMSNARIAQIGRPRDLYEQPASAFVADFIGDSNQAEGRITAVEQDRATLRLGGLEHAVRTRDAKIGDVRIAIRPEAIRLSGQQPSGAALQCQVVKAAYLGSHMEYTIDSPIGQLFVIKRNVREPFPPGTTVWATLDAHGLIIVP
jgi:iron(III) transport system ATP-binding protein